MHQAWHIFKKDIRYLRWEIALYLETIVAAWWLVAYNVFMTELLVMFAGAYLLAQLIYADALAGDRQFWITRPYRWSSLLLAKLLFILVIIDLPVCIEQWLTLLEAAFPTSALWQGLLWEQFLIFGICLSLAALAALTSGLASFVGTALALEGVAIGLDRIVHVPERSLYASEWVRSSLGFIVLLTASAVALYLQYQNRRTARNRLVAFYIVSAGILAYIFVPWSAAFAVQQRFSKKAFDPSALRIVLNTDTNTLALAMSKGNRVQIALPVAVEGIPPDDLENRDGIQVTLRAADGREARLQQPDFIMPRSPVSPSRPFTLIESGELDRAFFEAERDRSVTVRGTIFLTIFGNRREYTVPADQRVRSVAVTEQMRCLIAEFGLVCDSPFRSPKQWVTMGSGAGMPLTQAISYSPFPASLRFFPFERRWAPPRVVGAKDYGAGKFRQYATVSVTEPVAFVRREFAIPDVRLTDIAIPWRSRRVFRDGKSFVENEY